MQYICKRRNAGTAPFKGARAPVCCSMHFALIEMLLNPRSPPSVHLCMSWDQSNRSTRGQADTSPNPLVTNQNAHTSSKGWANGGSEPIDKLSHAVMLCLSRGMLKHRVLAAMSL